jgi:deoxyribodipyrimidine photolyase-related protein
VTTRPFSIDPLTGPVAQLTVVLGDQLDSASPALETLDRTKDAVLMMEVAEEATHVPSHRQRSALFLSAMRHFAQELQRRRFRLRYVRLDDPANTQSFTKEALRATRELAPSALRVVRPGEHRVLAAVQSWERRLKTSVEVLEDAHFLTPLPDFEAWRRDRRRLVMDHFYREQRKRLGILLTSGDKPAGGAWSLDTSNREAFTSAPNPPRPHRFRPDAVTRDVIGLVQRSFPDAPGRLSQFVWPVTRRQAKRALADFVQHRLPQFGTYQDAMWAGQPFLFHSLLSPALNLKLLQPRELVDAAVDAYEAGAAPLNAVEGFVRQVIGWREFIRGIYWSEGAEYGRLNALDAKGALPSFYWTGETDMACLRDALGQVLQYGYGHHIQRLMVTGNFALIAGISPRAVADWYLGMYVDAVDWVTLPNTLGMVMHADGGIVGTKPYASTGRYIDRMSNHCRGCRYDPRKRDGEDACPFTTFYWDFLLRHRPRFRKNPRMTMMLRNVDRLGRDERRDIRRRADRLRVVLGVAP